MTTRFTLIAAALGFAVAATAVADASAASAKATTRPVTTHGGTTHAIHGKMRHAVTTKVVRKARPFAGTIVVHRAPVRAKLVKLVATKAAVRVIKRPILQKQAMAHRIVVKKTIIR